jgi:xylulokinase
VESSAITGRLTKWASAQTGLPEGLIVVGGSGDNQAGAVGAGVVTPGMVLATLGTSGVIYAHAARPRKDISGAASGRLHTMCAANGTERQLGAWSITGCMLSAGGSLQWCRDELFPGMSFDVLMEEAARIRPGCDGLLFMPHLTGERCPYPDPAARGGWIGLTNRHTRGHLVRAVIEGVTFGMGQILDLVRGLGVPVERARLGGGGAKSALWRQMQADVYGCPVELTNTEEGPAFGAALLAGVGAGVFASVEEACSRTISRTALIEPSRDAAARYAPFREIYESLYGNLKDSFSQLLVAERR